MQFLYSTKKDNGTTENGVIEAVSQEAAIFSLKERGIIITNIEQINDAGFFSKFSLVNQVSNKDVVILSRQIATLFDAKVSALRVFTLLSAETENITLGKILGDVSESLQSGSSISKALSTHSNVFSKFYVSMVASGEESGKLPEAFSYLADYLDRQYELTSKVRGALTYPAFVIITFFGVMVLMMTFVIPKISSILTESGQDIPMYTKVILGASQFLVDFGFIFLALIVVAIGFLIRFIRTAKGKDYFDALKISFPILKNLFRKLYLSRIADNLNTMLSSGVTMVRALEITASVVGNNTYQKLLADGVEKVKGGKLLSDALSGNEKIPAIMIQMMRVGEETGDLGKILKTLADFYAREVKVAVDSMVDLIEPAMIVLLAIGVGTLLAAVLVPIYNISSAI